MLNIGVFGGSFDPVHVEHTQIIKSIFKEFEFDKVIVVPAYNPPHKNFLNVSEEHRLNMLKLALENLKKVFIDTYEIDLKKVVYSYETLDYLQKKYLNANLKMIIGADSYNKLDTWKNSQYIAKQYGFIVVGRKNIEIDKNSEFFRYSSFSSFTGSISSTMVREYIKKGKDVGNFINRKVFNYIKKNKLYKIEEKND